MLPRSQPCVCISSSALDSIQAGPPEGRTEPLFMRIAHVPTPLAPANSSINEIVRNLCAAHAARFEGDAPVVVVADSRRIAFEHARFVSVDYRRYCPREWFTKREQRFDHLYGFLGFPRRHHARLYLPAVEALALEKPPVVVVHEGHHGTPSLRYWQMLRPKSLIVLWVHIRLSRSYRKNELRRLLGYADGLIFPSEDLRRSVEDRIGRLSTPAAVIHNGIDTTTFHAEARRESSALRVAYVGEMAKFKGVHLLLQAMSHFEALSARPLELEVVGSSRWFPPGEISPYEQSLRELADTYKLNVRWTPRVSQQELGTIYRNSDVVCVPSLCDEAFGMVVLEALACGCGVVASPKGGLSEAGGGAAVYVDPTDETAFAKAVARFANDPSHREEMSRRGIARAQGASWSAAYDRFWDAAERFRGAVLSGRPDATSSSSEHASQHGDSQQM
jgi:glycosyltransferase involved in cell wall biosynthesis